MNRNAAPNKELIKIRIIWLGLILGQVAFAVAIALKIVPSQLVAVRPQPVLIWVNLGLLLVEVPVVFVIRMVIFRRGKVDGGIRPESYSMGNMIFWMGCESISFFGLIIVILTGSWWPTIVLVAIALGLQAITFPVGGQ